MIKRNLKFGVYFCLMPVFVLFLIMFTGIKEARADKWYNKNNEIKVTNFSELTYRRAIINGTTSMKFTSSMPLKQEIYVVYKGFSSASSAANELVNLYNSDGDVSFPYNGSGFKMSEKRADVTTNKNFEITLDLLEPNTIYVYFVAQKIYGSNGNYSVEGYYSNNATAFKTPAIPNPWNIKTETKPATDISDTYVTMHGSTLAVNGYWDLWYEYTQSDENILPTSNNEWPANYAQKITIKKQVNNYPYEIGTVSQKLNELTPEKNYSYRFCVKSTDPLTIDKKTYCGNILSFKTLPLQCRVYISANPASIYPGKFSTLSWSSSNCSSVSIQTIGNVPLSGSKDLSPGNNTTYIIDGLNSVSTATANTKISIVGGSDLVNQNDAVKTFDATNVSDQSAKLAGSFKANTLNFSDKEKINLYFRYSSTGGFPPVFCNDIYGSDMRSTKEITLEADMIGKNFTSTISGLIPNTTYYYCAIGSTAKSIVYGDLKYFTSTPDQAVTIRTDKPLVASGSSAYLNGFYNTIAGATTWFEYKKINTSTVATEKVNTSKSAGFNELDVSDVQDGQDPALQKTITTNNNSNASSKKITTKTNEYAWSKKIGNEDHTKGSAKISHLLTGLSPNATYQYHAVAKSKLNSNIFYGNDITFNTLNSNTITDTNNYSSSDGENSNYQNNTTLVLGQKATAPDYALVHYHEGIETVLARQIVNNPDLAEAYGYKEGNNLQNFAWTLAHNLAKTFGYVSSTGKEIRVSPVDRAAYELRLENGYATVYEYLDSKIVNIQKASSVLRNKYGYEYYFKKK